MLRDLNKNQKFETDEIFTYTKDHLGSIRDITNNNAELVQRYDFSSYGITKLEKDPANPTYKFIENNYTYNSQDYDIETGLTLHGVRWYDARTGKFISHDMIWPLGGVNGFDYASGNPLRFSDPLGLLSFEENLARRERLNDNLITMGIKTTTSFAIGAAFNTAARRQVGLGIGLAELIKNRFLIATLGTRTGTIGAFALSTAFKSVAVGISFTIGQDIGNRIGAFFDTIVDDAQGVGETSIFEKLFFGSGQPNKPPSGCSQR